MAFFFTRIIQAAVLIFALLNGTNFLLRWKSYTVQVNQFKQLSTKAADADPLTAVSKFTSELRRRYPNQITSEPQWIPLSAGGMHLKVQFLYGALSEYVALFASVGTTSGRSGMHWANSTCTVLTGEVGRVSDSYSSHVKETFTQGQNFRHTAFDSHVYFFKDHSVAACYGRGVMPISYSWVISGAFANGDVYSGGRLLYVYARLVFDSAAHYFTETADYLKKKATGKWEL